MSVPIPRMTETALSRNPGILAFEVHLASYVWAAGSGNMSPILPTWKPWSDLGLACQGLVPKTVEQQKSSASFSN